MSIVVAHSLKSMQNEFMKTILLIILLFPSLVMADEWSTGDTKREVSFQTLWLIDYAQTRNIAANPYKWYEQNNYLGAHPTTGAVNRYFLVGSILHFGVSKLLPEKYRAPFQYGTIAIEVGYVAHNYSIGISAKF